MKQYIISKKELKELIEDLLWSGKYDDIKIKTLTNNFLKSKIPIEVIASGEVITIGILDKFKGALSFNIGKSGTLIFVEDKEIK